MRRNRNSPNLQKDPLRHSPRGKEGGRKQASSGSIPPLLLKSPDARNISPPISFPQVTRSPKPLNRLRIRSNLPSPTNRSFAEFPQASSQAFLLQVGLRSPVQQPRGTTARHQRSKGSPVAVNRVVEFASMSKVGRTRSVPKTHNQDSYLSVQRFGDRGDASLFGVFDGHGAYGHDVSQFLRDHFEDFVSKGLSHTDLGNPELVIDALKDGFRAANMGVKKGTIDSAHSGSTCVVVMVVGDICFCGNVGDSRAILLRQCATKWMAIPLSRDHKPTVEDERARIIERGGVIAQHTNAAGLPTGPLRVWLADQPLPGLAMTRSIGDHVASKIGVIGEPEVVQLMLTNEDEAIVLASDGLWELLSSEEVTNLIQRHSSLPTPQIVDHLMDEAQRRWARNGTTWDDTTILLVRLRKTSRFT